MATALHSIVRRIFEERAVDDDVSSSDAESPPLVLHAADLDVFIAPTPPRDSFHGGI